MAAGTSAPTPSTPPPGGARPGDSGRFIEYDRYIDAQIRRTRRQVKGIDLAAALMLLAAGSMAYFLLAALVDHWLVPGGMGFAGRLVCLALYLLGSLAFVLMKLGPLVLRRINPVYAAQTIERNRPGLKNSLVNFLMLRSSGEELPQRVFEAIEEQAATGLSAAHVETAVDRTPLVKLLTVLMVLLSLAALYRVLSPKNPFTSIRRVIDPWADISAPTRVAIAEIQPGNADGYHDQHLNVTALVSGLSSDETVTVHYSTADGQVIDYPVRMTLPEAGYRFTAELPADAAGLQQDIIYWITAGDAISPRYGIQVHTAPSITVDSLEYKYPAYSEIAARSVPKHGNIQALEGTQVTIRATASHEIRSADVDFDCDGRRDLAMKIDGRKASVTFPLSLKAGMDQPEHESYQLRFTNLEGHENPKPIRYTIEVIRDLPPEIAIVEPQLQAAEEFNLAAGASLPLEFSASDPDYKLADVRLHVRRGNEKLLDEPLLAETRGGPYRRRFVFATRQFKLKPGETLSLWAAADDNRQPKANHVETPHYTLRIVSPDGQQEPDQLADAKSNKQPSPDTPQNGDAKEKPQRGPRRPGEQMEPNDPQQPGEPPADGEKPEEQDKKQPKSERDAGKKRNPNSGDAEQGDQQPADENQGGEGDKSSPDKSNGEKQPGQRSAQDEEPSEDSQGGGDKSTGEKSAGKKSAGDQQDAGEGAEGEQSEQDSGKEKSERVDPEKEAGRAIDEINKFFDEKKKDKGEEDKPAPDKPQEEPKKEKSDGKKGPQGNEDQPSDQEQKPAPDKKQPSGGGKSKSQEEQGEQGDDQQGDPAGGDQPSEGKKPGEQKAGEQKAGQGEPNDSQQGGESGEKGQGKKEAGKKKPGEQSNGGDASQGDEPAPGGEKNPGAEKKMPAGTEPSEQGEQEPSSGDKQQGEKKPKGEGAKKGDEQNAAADEQGGQEGQPGDEKGQQSGKGKSAKKAGEQGAKEPGEKKDAGNDGAAGEEQDPADGKTAGEAGDDKKKTEQQSGGSGNSGQDREMKEKEGREGQEGADAKVGDEEPKGATGKKKPQPGKGGQTKGEGKPDKNPNGDKKDPNEDVEGGDPEGQDRGEGGAGKPGGNKDPVASPKGMNKQTEKKQTSDEKGPANTDEEGNSGSEDGKQSDSKSDKSGDLSGGGGQGGGQRAKSPGKGAAGQTSDAEQGGGQSDETGEGPTGDKAGDQQKGNKRTGGASSEEKGPGSKKQPGGSKPGEAEEANSQEPEQATEQGKQPREKMNGQNPKNPAEQPSGDEKQGEDNGQPNQQPGEQKGEQQPGGQPTPGDKGGHDLQGKTPGGGRTNPTGGGVPGSDNREPPAAPSDTSEPGGEDPNLEYTRKATDLAVERLKDQLDEGNPDQDLLDKLKWSRDDAEQFVRRWEELKKSAKSPGPQGEIAREQLDEALRSLGLQPRGTTLSGGRKRDDQRRNLIESRRAPPPPEYAEQYREFSKGLLKGKK